MQPDYITSDKKIFTLNCNGRLVDLSTPKIMGILNMTPDSFSDGGRFNSPVAAVRHAEAMLKDGAEIIDIGPQSTRPGANFLTATEEIQRVGNLISTLKKEFPESLISLDTFWSETVEFGYNEGIDMVNDISAGQFDPKLFPAVARTGLPYVLMHVNPSYKAMHEKISYDNITVSLNKFFSEKASELKELGVKDIILDPGFGFGKTQEDQLKLIDEVQFLGFGTFPLLIGISRKSFIYKPLNKKPTEIVAETQRLHLKVLQQGAKILRVHDVKEARQTLDNYLSESV